MSSYHELWLMNKNLENANMLIEYTVDLMMKMNNKTDLTQEQLVIVRESLDLIRNDIYRQIHPEFK